MLCLSRYSLLLAGVISLGNSATAVETAPAPREKEFETKIEALIDQLAAVAERDIVYGSSTSNNSFIPFDVSWRSKEQPPQCLRELVKLGVVAVPHLIAHLDDNRRTKVKPVGKSYCMRGDCLLFSLAFFDFNRRTQQRPIVPDEEKVDLSDPDHHFTVGDLCFVALGEIVNRNFHPYQFGDYATTHVVSPTWSRFVCDAAKIHWADLTPEKHKATLLEDMRKPDTLSLRFLNAMPFPRVQQIRPHPIIIACIRTSRPCPLSMACLCTAISLQ